MAPVVGVDPGGKHLGLVLRNGATLVKARVLVRDGAASDHTALQPWVEATNTAVLEYVSFAAHMIDAPSVWEALDTDQVLLAVEGVVAPTGFSKGRRAPIDPSTLLALGAAFGGILAAFPQALIVRPGHNGDGPDLAYPEGIRSGVRGLGGPTKHARSAWDVAAHAEVLAGIRRAERRVRGER